MLPIHTRRRIFTTLGSRPSWVFVAALLVTGLLAVPFVGMQPDATASQEPGGTIFEARDRIEERFVSTVLPIGVIIEAADGSITDKAVLTDLLAAGERLRNDPDLAGTMLRTFVPEAGVDLHGVLTIADLVEHALPSGIATASQGDIDAVVTALIDTFGTESSTLSLSIDSTFDEQLDRWRIPAITTFALADNTVLDFPTGGVTLGADTEPEEYKRAVVEAMRSASGSYRNWGIAIDVNLTSAEQGETAGPFIGFTILAILAIVGITFRSYWVMAVSGAALSAMIIWLYGIANLIGLKDDLILGLIVPIAMVSFGIDFAFHSVGRYREERALGHRPMGAFVVGMTGVAGALTLALVSDAIAFLSNTISGIESIIQFGVGTAIALASAYILLGFVTPLAVASIEERVGDGHRTRRATAVGFGGSVLAGTFAMVVSLLLVFIAPAAGVAALFAYVMTMVILPARLVRPSEVTAARKAGPSRFAQLLATIAVALTRRWRVVLGAATLVTVGATALAVQVPTEFDVKDFFSSDTDFVVGLDKVGEHLGDLAGEPAQISIEADITDPAVVGAIAQFQSDLIAVEAPTLARDSTGVLTNGGVVDLLEDMWASPVARAVISERMGVTITDGDGDRVPDTSQQLSAIYAVAREIGVPIDETRSLRTPQVVSTDIWLSEEGSTGATIISVGLLDTVRQESVVESRDALAPLVEGLEARLSELDPAAQVVVTGDPVVRQESLEAVSRALRLSLPLSVVLCLIVASLFMRSVRLGLVSIVPILMTVSILYGFMNLAGFSINIVTATIGAVSIGIGIDFAIHYTMRYREELAAVGDRIEAIRRTSRGTGVALVASASSSVVGFGILSLAPMPLFASYGLLTAVMIAIAAGATLIVLPSLLMMVTKDELSHAPAAEELVTV